MIIEACAGQAYDHSLDEYNANNGNFLAKLIEEEGVIVKSFSDDVYDAFGEASEEVFEETCGKNTLVAEVRGNFVAARANVGGWMNLSEPPYYAQRNRILGL